MINIYLIYILLSFLILTSVSIISYKLNLVDRPNKRKIHLKPTAYTGGIALSFIYILAVYLFNFPSNKLDLILSIGFLIGFVGFIDDKYNLNVGGKLSLQIFPIIYLIILEDFNLNLIGDYEYFIFKLNSFSIPFSLFSVLFLINAFNYFDGIDGSLSIVTISTLCILFFLIPSNNIQLFLTSVMIPIIVFLFFNFSIFNLPKLFLGDSGSLLLGFIIAFTLINLANQNIVHPILLAWSIVIFVYEFLSINFIRLKVNENIFRAGLDHLHHMLLKKTKSVLLTNLYISLINIILFIIGYLSFSFINPLTSLILFILLFIIFLILRYRLFKKN